MKPSKIIQIIAACSMLVSCLKEAPVMPTLTKNYNSDQTGIVTPDPIPPGPTPPPGPVDAELPTAEELALAPVNSGFRLYTFYCEKCHRPIQESTKRGRIVDVDFLTSNFLKNFGPHGALANWPTKVHAPLVTRILTEDFSDLVIAARKENGWVPESSGANSTSHDEGSGEGGLSPVSGVDSDGVLAP